MSKLIRIYIVLLISGVTLLHSLLIASSDYVKGHENFGESADCEARRRRLNVLLGGKVTHEICLVYSCQTG